MDSTEKFYVIVVGMCLLAMTIIMVVGMLTGNS